MRAAGLPEPPSRNGRAAFPAGTGDYGADVGALAHSGASRRLCFRMLPQNPANEAEQPAADALLLAARASRETFLAAHVEQIYDRLTKHRSIFRRLDDLAYAAAENVPGLVPTRQEVEAEAAHRQGEKDGVEIDQGLFLAHVLSRPEIGQHLCHAMLLPRPESEAPGRRIRRSRLARSRCGPPYETRQGGPSRDDQPALPQRGRRHDPGWRPSSPSMSRPSIRTTDIAVMRGVAVENEKYRGKRISAPASTSPISTSQDSLPLVPDPRPRLRAQAFARRRPAESAPDDVNGRGTEKPWIAALDIFAICGHCQALLSMDYVLAAPTPS